MSVQERPEATMRSMDNYSLAFRVWINADFYLGALGVMRTRLPRRNTLTSGINCAAAQAQVRKVQLPPIRLARGECLGWQLLGDWLLPCEACGMLPLLCRVLSSESYIMYLDNGKGGGSRKHL